MKTEGKKVLESRTIMTQVMYPQDANSAGNVHGGTIMKLIDTAAGVVAIRHCRTNVVTASIDRLDFFRPIFVGNLVTIKASLNLVSKTSMEIGVRVDAEDLRKGETRRVASAFLTFVALDKDGRPTQAPPLVLETEEDIRRNREAGERRLGRLQSKDKPKT